MGRIAKRFVITTLCAPMVVGAGAALIFLVPRYHQPIVIARDRPRSKFGRGLIIRLSRRARLKRYVRGQPRRAEVHRAVTPHSASNSTLPH